MKPRQKFNAQAVVRDGHRFPSKLEAAYCGRLDILKEAGEVLFYLRQIPFHLPAGIVYRADYLVFYADGNCDVVDCKGMDTPNSRMKRAQVEALYPLKITIINKV